MRILFLDAQARKKRPKLQARPSEGGPQSESVAKMSSFFAELHKRINMFVERYLTPLFQIITGLLTGRMPDIKFTPNPFEKYFK